MSNWVEGQQKANSAQQSADLPVAALETVRYDKHTGLVPVVVQDANTEQVLTLAYANREALKRTLGTGQAWFWSRSRQEYWRKGATSGNVQKVVEVRVDCDGDAVIYRVIPAGPACHTGEISCFFRQLKHHSDDVLKTHSGSDAASEQAKLLVQPAQDGLASQDVAENRDGAAGDGAQQVDLKSVLEDLWLVISDRFEKRPQGSYTTYLFEHGVDKVAKKVGEEAVEVALAAKNAVALGPDAKSGQQELVAESADLLYHLLALWKTAGITPDEVANLLAKRANG